MVYCNYKYKWPCLLGMEPSWKLFHCPCSCNHYIWNKDIKTFQDKAIMYKISSNDLSGLSAKLDPKYCLEIRLRINFLMQMRIQFGFEPCSFNLSDRSIWLKISTYTKSNRICLSLTWVLVQSRSLLVKL